MSSQTTPRPEIPLTVIGGFLGAGKTTLLNRLLREAGGRRLAVLVNDFGAIDIDAELIESQDGETISLTNGCICCGLGGEFMFALAGLRDRDDPPEHVVVEASGIGDPATIVGYGDMPGFTRDAAIVVVDAEAVRSNAGDPGIGKGILGQLRAADLIVLNKTDLITEAELAETRQWLRGALPLVTIVDTSFADVPVALLLETREIAAPAERSPRAVPGHDHDASHAFAAWSWTGDPPLDGAALCVALPELPAGVVRGKGFLFLREDPEHRYLLQLVGRRWNIRRDRAWGDDAPGSRLVLIGVAESIDEVALTSTMTALSSPAA